VRGRTGQCYALDVEVGNQVEKNPYRRDQEFTFDLTLIKEFANASCAVHQFHLELRSGSVPNGCVAMVFNEPDRKDLLSIMR
jgi:hypothetical protein